MTEEKEAVEAQEVVKKEEASHEAPGSCCGFCICSGEASEKPEETK